MSNVKPKIFIIDTSVILSGKPISLKNGKMVTTQGVSKELTPGGKDYQNFQFLIEKGLSVYSPTKESIKHVRLLSEETGDINRLSDTDTEILALAFEINNEDKEEPIILTDDYSIQNVANKLKIKFESVSQSGIKKRFKWQSRCTGCGKKFKDNINICPICGSTTKSIVTNMENIK
jgi:UPF0271 protein